jgi:hypothetical protein
MMHNRYPDFYCIGVQKAGTTWLYENLSKHSEFWLPFLKEVDYFNYLYLPKQREWITPFLHERCVRNILQISRGQGWWANKEAEQRLNAVERVARLLVDPINDEWYARVFNAAPPEAIAGDITPEYSLLPKEGIEHLLRLNPQAKIVLMLRNPIDRDLSHARMVLKNEPEIIESDLLRVTNNPDVYCRSDYPKIIADWQALVPEKQLKIVFYDHIVSRPVALLMEITEFLGRESHEADWLQATKTVHKGREAKIPDSVYTTIAARHAAVIEWMAERYPNPCRDWLAVK